eukprot:TRINITY_DN135001_c2_g1_i1.p1 TRINITY_DN135001_c2_g1~~TRINITY_DN135001_c2_g1_i1.p1  ORF type:complete len:851 (-),score=73.41 TRINITY_DN135001_c2_g1_i1:4535-7087(-)
MKHITRLSIISTSFMGHLDRLFSWSSEKLSKLESYLLPFDDFLVEDLGAFASYIQRRLMLFMYKFALVFMCLQYFTYNSVPLLGRILFSSMFVYVIGKLTWVFPTYDLNTLKLWGVLDLLLGYVLNLYVNCEDSKKYNLTILFLLVSFCYFSASISAKFTIVLLVTFINTFMYPLQGITNSGWSYATIFLAVYCFLFCMGQSHNIISAEFAKKFMQARKSTEVELQNKSMFVASISHDLKNPLNSLLGCLDLLKTSPNLSASDKTYMLAASYSGQIMHYLIGNILDVSKIEAGKFDIDRLPMDIMEEVKKIVLIESELSKKKGINLYKRVLSPLPKLVYGDAMRFAQILINIIGNSIKFTSKGYVAILLRWANTIDEAKGRDEENDSESLIPPEEYFMVAMTSPRPALPSPLMRNRHAYSQDCADCTLEEFKEPIHEKMAKYNSSPQSKGGRRYPPLSTTSAPSFTASNKAGPSKFQKQSTCQNNTRSHTETQEVLARRVSKFKLPSAHFEAAYEEDKEIVGDSGLLVVDIIDTGIGLTEEEQKRLFKPFNQANSAVKSKYGGTGLGLWITKQLVYLMSGFIELRSQPQKGTRFTITLPFKIIRNEEPYSPTRSSEEGKDPVSQMSSALTIGVSKIFSKAAADLREHGKAFFKGMNKILKRMTVLLIEDEDTPDDSHLEQILNQLKSTDCRLTYATYSTVLQILKDREYRFDTMIVMASSSAASTMQLVTTIMKTIKDSDYKQIPLSIASGILQTVHQVEQTIQAEFDQAAKIYQLTFPLKDGDVINTLNKMKGRAAQLFALTKYEQQQTERDNGWRIWTDDRRPLSQVQCQGGRTIQPMQNCQNYIGGR